MKWSEVRPKILEVISAAVGIETHWRDRERPFVTPTDEAMCLLHVIGTSGVGNDEFRLEHNEDTNKLDVTQAGIRNFSVSVMVESYNQADDKTALEYLEDIRDAIARPAVQAMFREVNLAILDATQTTDLSHDEDDHAVSSASFDLMFAYGNNVSSDDGKLGLDPLDWIETVEITDEYEY